MSKPDQTEGQTPTVELTNRIFEAMPGGIVHVLIDGSIARANRAALSLLGMSFDEVQQRYISDWTPETIFEDGSPCTAENYPVSRALQTGESQPAVTIGVKRPDGETTWAVFTAVPVKDPDTGETTGAVVTFLDITGRKRAEVEQERVREQLLLADRMASIGTLAAGVAHEINNPLTYVITNLQLLGRQLMTMDDPLTEAMRARVADVNDGLDRIRNVVRDLSTFARDGNGDANSDIHTVLESALRMAASELRYRAQVVRNYGQTPMVRANSSRLGQVFLNLLVNACHAIPVGDVQSNEIRITTNVDSRGRVKVEIRDTGESVSPEARARIFEPFTTDKEPVEGNGLGLYICHNIVKGLGGTLDMLSASSGNTFRVLLPATTDVDTSSIESDSALLLSPEEIDVARILIVDDEPAILKIFGFALARHELTLAKSGRQALQLLKEGTFDMVFCDLIMPDVTGMEVYEAARRRDDSLVEHFIFMTGGAFTARARQFLDSFKGPLLNKPFGVPEVERMVAKQVANRSARDQ